MNGKPSSPVLRGLGASDGAQLLDPNRVTSEYPLFGHDQSGPHGHYRDYVGSLPPILLVAYCSF